MRLLAPIVILSLLQATAQVGPASQAAVAHEQRQRSFRLLGQQIFAFPGATNADRLRVNAVPPDEVEATTTQLHQLIIHDIEDTLAEQEADAAKVSQNIRDILGDTSIDQWDQNSSNTPYAGFLPMNGANIMMAAYGILRGGGALPDTRSYLEFYVPSGGTWRLRTAAGLADFDGRTFSVSPVEAGKFGQVWVLAWGRIYGNTGGNLLVRLYAFDGTEVRSIWQREDLTWGKVTVSGPSVTLEYDKDYHSAERVRETLHVAPEGLK